MKIALGADHAGFEAKKMVVEVLTEDGHKVLDFGTHSDQSTDYPDFAARVSKAVSGARCDRGILVCGTGIGMAIAANKILGIRAAAPWSVKTAKLASQHNWANVLCLSARVTKSEISKKIIRAWLSTPWDKGGRHERRVKKIQKLETKC